MELGLHAFYFSVQLLTARPFVWKILAMVLSHASSCSYCDDEAKEIGLHYQYDLTRGLKRNVVKTVVQLY